MCFGRIDEWHLDFRNILSYNTLRKILRLSIITTHMFTHDWSRNPRENGFRRYLIVHAYDESAGEPDIASLLIKRICGNLSAIRRIDRSHSLRWASPRSQRVYLCRSRTAEPADIGGGWFLSGRHPKAGMMPVRSRSVPQCATAAKRLPHRQSRPGSVWNIPFRGDMQKPPVLEVSSDSASWLSVQFRPFRGVTPHTAVKRLRKVYPRFERHKKRSPSKSGDDRQDSIFPFP